MSVQNFALATEYDFQSIDEAFPSVKHGCDPLTECMPHLALLQIRRAKSMTKGGIALIEETQQAEAGNTQVAKVIEIGRNCFKHPDTGKPWPEGAWFEVGDYMRIAKFNGFRFTVQWKVPEKWKDVPNSKYDQLEEIKFVMFEPIHLVGKVRGDPRAITTFA